MKYVLVCATVAATAGVAAAQPVQWRSEDGGNGHWYQVVTRNCGAGIAWDEASSAATSSGGHLASITSQAENQFVFQRLADTNGGFCQFTFQGSIGGWIGGLRDSYDSQWRWITGEAWSVQAWAVGQNGSWCPRECGDLPDRVAFGSEYGNPVSQPTWWDTPARDVDLHRSYVVEWSADCNGDGIVDKGQILSGELSDANNDGVPDGSVRITRQPTDQAAGVDQPVHFTVEASSLVACSTPVAFRWQRRNPQVPDDGAPNAWLDLQDGGGFVNTGTLSMAILRPTAGLATGYRCRISGGCGCEQSGSGEIYTNTVNFAAACPSDFNNDGSVDGDDVIQFFERWDAGC